MEEYGLNWQRHAYIKSYYNTPGTQYDTVGYYWTPSVDMGTPLGMILPGPDGKSTYEYHMGEQPKPDMHIWHKGNTDGPETNIDHNGKVRLERHHGRELKELPKKLKKVYRPIIRTFLERAGMAADAIGAALEDILGTVPIVVYYDSSSYYHREVNGVDVTPHG